MPQNAINGTKRIAVPAKVVKLAEEVQETLGVGSIAEVFAVLLTRYGNHLKTSWEVRVLQVAPPPATSPLPEPRLTVVQPLVQPLTEPEQDPAIARIAALVENF